MKNICNNWDADSCRYIHFSPDDSVGEENRAWQGCPTIAVTKKGRLFAGWYTGGALEPCIQNYNVLVASNDGGESWSKPILTVGSDPEGRLRKIDIELWINEDNALWVMWTASPYYEGSRLATIKTPFVCDYHREFLYTELMVCKNPDDDTLVWEKPRRMCDGFLRNRPILTSKGRIIVPAYDYRALTYKLRCSDDGGSSFYDVEVSGKPEANVFDEMAVCEHAPGTLRMLARTRKGYYLCSDSLDGGDTWTVATEYEKAPSSRCYYGKLKNGMIAYVRNVSDTQRTGMKLMLSCDNGATFPYEMILDERDSVSYPELDEDDNGNLYIVYDRERDNRIKLNRQTWQSEAAKEILLCRLTVQDVISGRLSGNSFVQRILSKGKKNTVDE